MTKENIKEGRKENGQEARESLPEVSYRRNLHRSHMCIKEQGTAEGYELKMLEGRQIPHLLKVETTVMEGETYYLYDISGKQQADDYLSGKRIGYDILWQLLFSIKELCRVLPDYLLRETGVCLKGEYIYVNLADGSLYFTYLPFWQKSLSESFGYYMEEILRKTDHQDQAATELAYEVYQMCQAENASLCKILETVMEEKKKGESDRGKQEETAEEYFAEEMPETSAVEKGKIWEQAADRIKMRLKNHVWFNRLSVQLEELLKKEVFCSEQKNSGQEKQKEKKKKKDRSERREKKLTRKAVKTDFRPSEDSVAVKEERGKAEENMLLHPTEILAVCRQEPTGKLIYQGTHGCEDILITKDEFLIGKNRQQAQGIIEAEGISRLHARISRQEKGYYLEDLNSTNGTYLNEIPLEYRQKKELCRNDRVRFGGEEYLFF